MNAGVRAMDPGWALPLHPSYEAMLASRVADIANASPDAADSGQLAATYLRTFVGEVPWVHVDNGSAAWLERAAGLGRRVRPERRCGPSSNSCIQVPDSTPLRSAYLVY